MCVSRCREIVIAPAVPPDPGHTALDSARRLANFLEVDPKGPNSSQAGDIDTASSPAVKASTPEQPSANTTTGVELKFLTINVQKARPNSPWSTSFLCWTNTPRTFFFSQKLCCPHTTGPFFMHSVIGAIGYTILRPTPRSNLTAFRKLASPITSSTWAVVVGLPTRSTLHGHQWCPLSHYPKIATVQQYAR